jgi:glutamate synthase domain-containing protein 2
MRSEFIFFSILSSILLLVLAYFVDIRFLLAFILHIPLVGIGLYDMFQKKHALMRNFPLVGRSRYILEWFRPKIFQYFVEPDHDGRPFSRINRSMVYARAKAETSTTPFGTQYNVYDESYEWMNHSIAAIDPATINHNQRVKIGGPACTQPYEASIFNVSAMSFGSLSSNAIEALNGGAAIGGFAHNTGEGGISPYHNKHKGDLIFQIGTGYFGCRTEDGNFDPELFKQKASQDNVKMIELKLSQGAKPGHGGILPASKATKEIAAIRHIEVGKAVLSPPYHKAFSTPLELLELIERMRELSGGKPIGFKLCIGHKSEFLSICKAMVKTGITPDFITIDGGEGGTGAAPVEFSNSVGMPYKDGLSFAYNALEGFDLKKKIKLLASGKIVSGFDVYKTLALGADACYSARAMMMALGCIQALECNRNSCPTGVATQDPDLVKGLVVEDKKHRVANYHKETVHSFIELMAASGIPDVDMINRALIYSRIAPDKIARYDQLYPYISKGCLLNEETIPKNYRIHMELADVNVFMKHAVLEKLHL